MHFSDITRTALKDGLHPAASAWAKGTDGAGVAFAFAADRAETGTAGVGVVVAGSEIVAHLEQIVRESRNHRRDRQKEGKFGRCRPIDAGQHAGYDCPTRSRHTWYERQGLRATHGKGARQRDAELA